MRPEVLFPLFEPATNLPGVGPRIAKMIERLAGPHVVDLVWHLPVGLIDRTYAPPLAEAEAGRVVTLTVTVGPHQPSRNRRQPYRIPCFDDTGSVTLVFFHARGDFLNRILPEGETRVVSGTLEAYGGNLQMPHPDHVGTLDELATIQRPEAVYPMTTGLGPKMLHKAVGAALERTQPLPEWLDPAYLRVQSWPDWHAALATAHQPGETDDLAPLTPARARLAYDELLANQLTLALVRRTLRRAAGRALIGDGRHAKRVLDALPFALTGAQLSAVAEISADMAQAERMLRMLQGDVGSGKTVVALLAMLIAVESGGQAALMAPTEILARQHLATLTPLATAAGLDIAILTGREKGKTRAATLERLADGSLPLVVGTHALFQDDVAFADLAMTVIDEQHRFGVHQRLALAQKGKAADVLVMTATPIPRTLTLTAYGDMDVSRLNEKPPGRLPIDTRAVPLERLDQVVAAVARALSGPAKVYWVCPLVEESETLDVAAAQERFDVLKAQFGARVGMVHGRMKGAEKDQVMADFATGAVDLLVATTVIEVGVDVPQATVMVIEHAERFGLAQLHQLRGRIGRGTDASTCLLLYANPLSETARARLTVMRETEDGFVIAEEDLKLRGAGELLGTRQSGLPAFKLADLAVHGELLATARDDAALILSRDPELTSERGQALRTLLYLFERDAAIKNLRSG